MRFEEQTELSRIAGLRELAAFKEIPSPPFDFNSSSKAASPPYAYLQHLYFLRHHQHATLAKAYAHPDLDLKPPPSLSSTAPVHPLHGLSFHRAFAFRGDSVERRLFLDLEQCEDEVAATIAEEEVAPIPAGTPALYRYMFKATRRIVRVGRALTVLFALRTQLLAFDPEAWLMLSQQQQTPGQAAAADATAEDAPSPALFSPSAPQAAGCDQEAGLLDMLALQPGRGSHRGDGVRGPVAALDATLLSLWRHPLDLPWISSSDPDADALSGTADLMLSDYLEAGGASGFTHCDAATRRVSLPGAPAECGGTDEPRGAGRGAAGGSGSALPPSVFGCPGWLEDRVLPKYRQLASASASN
jgi:hypothetical protein